MNPKKDREAMLRALCAEAHAGDGVSPKDERRDERRGTERSRIAWKDAQLARSAERALAAEIESSSSLAALGVSLVSVMAEDGGRTLRVVVSFAAGRASEVEVLALLAAARGRLRAELTRVIRRKRAPELVFAALPREGGKA